MGSLGFESKETPIPSVGGLRLKAVPRGFPLGAFLCGMALVAGAAATLLHLDRLGFPLCLFKAATGLPCFTCGGTRAMARLVSGDLLGAFRMNPLVTLATLALPPWALADLALLTRGRALGLELPKKVSGLLVTVAVLALLANWVYLVAMGR